METDEEVRNEDSSISKHNKNIIYNFLSQSIVCSVALIVIWIAFIIECIMTWINNSGQSYGIQMIDPSVLIDMGGNVPLLVNRWQIYRIFTATLLHAGILHIGMNTLSLIGFCAQVEFAFSKWIFIIVYIVGGIQGNMLTDFYNIHFGNHSIIAIGASTSICAVMGLFIANVFILYQKTQDITNSKKTVASMLISLLVVSLVPGVDFFGHFGSLISGFLLGLCLIPKDDRELRRTKIVGIVSMAAYTIALLTIFL